MNTCQSADPSLWADAAIIATMLGALTFVIVYAVTARWWATTMGRHVMTFMAAILVVAFLATLTIFYGTSWPHRDAIRTAAWGAIAACLWWRVFILIKAQQLTRAERS